MNLDALDTEENRRIIDKFRKKKKKDYKSIETEDYEGKDDDSKKYDEDRVLCNDWLFAVLFLVLFCYVTKLGVVGLKEIVQTPICAKITPDVAAPTILIDFYKDCFSFIISGSGFAASNCLAFSIAKMQGIVVGEPGDTRRSLQEYRANNPDIRATALETETDSLVSLVFENCLQTTDPEKCAAFAVSSFLGANRTAALIAEGSNFVTQCWDPLISSPLTSGQNCLGFVLDQLSSTARSKLQGCEAVSGAFQSQVVNLDQNELNQEILTCLKATLAPDIGLNLTRALDVGCLEGIYGEQPLPALSAAMGCAQFGFEQGPFHAAAETTQLLVNSCLSPMASELMQGSPDLSMLGSLLAQCAKPVLELKLGPVTVQQIFVTGSEKIVQISNAVANSQAYIQNFDSTCLGEVIADPIGSFGCILSFLKPLLGLERLLCEDLIQNKGLGAVASMAGKSFEKLLWLHKVELFHLFLEACALSIVGALAFLLLVSRKAHRLVRLAVSASLMWMLLMCFLNLATGFFFIALVLLVAVAVKALWLSCIWGDLDFVAQCLATSTEVIRAHPFIIVMVMGTVAIQVTWLAIFVGAIYQVSLTAIQTDYFSFFLVLSLFWTEAVLRGAIAMTVIGIGLEWTGHKATSKTSCIFSWTKCFGHAACPVSLRSLLRAYTEHFGSLCFGSLIVALLCVFRYLATKAQKNKHRPSCSWVIYCCFTCCIQAVEQFNIDAYVQVVSHRMSYLQSCKETTLILVSNGLLLVSLDHSIEDVLSMCQSSIAFAVTGVIAIISAYEKVPFSLLCCAMIFTYILSFVVMNATRISIEISMSTIMMSFLLKPEEFRQQHPDIYNKLCEFWENRYSCLPSFHLKV